MPQSSYFNWFNTAGPQQSFAVQGANPRFAGMAWTQNLLGSELPGALGTSLGQSDREVKDQDKTYMRSGTPFDAIAGYLSGSGALTVGDETTPQSSTNWSDNANPKKSPPPVGQLSISPGGSFNLSSSRGWSVAGNPISKSLGVTVPAFGNQGTVGLQGSFNQQNPYISGTFQLGRPAGVFSNQEEIDINKTQSSVNSALGVNQTYDPNTGTYAAPYTSPEPSGRALYNQMLSYTDDKNYSPAAALRNYYYGQ